MPNPSTYQFNLPQRGRPSDVMLNEVWYPGIQAYWETSTSSRIFDAILGIKALVIHATAGSSSAGAVSVMKEGKASFHWLLPDEDEPQHGQLVWACAPEARAAWHVRNSCSHPSINDGADKVNHWSLGIEVVNRQAGSDRFSDWQIPARRSDPGTAFPWARLKTLVLTPEAEDGVPSVALDAQPASSIKSTTDQQGCCQG